MVDKTFYQFQADACKALAHAIRIEIIDLIDEGECGFSELSEKTGIVKSSLSQHLSVLVERGILIQRKVGVNSYFKLASPKVTKACQLMREVVIERLEKNNELLNQFKS